MAVITRKRKNQTVYFVATYWKRKQYVERIGTERREAERVDARNKKAVKAGTFVPPLSGGRATVASFAADWLARRTNRSADQERYLIEDVALTAEWFAGLKLPAVTSQDVVRLFTEIKATRRWGNKVTSNSFSALKQMFRSAVFVEAIPSNPCDIPRSELKLSRKPDKQKLPYPRQDSRELLSEKVAITRRVFVALALYTGMRCGEICGRRWRDWIRDAEPLTALHVHTQYDDRPLKGDDDDTSRERKVPVHPELERILTWWWTEGWKLANRRTPRLDDFIVPSSRSPEQCYTKSGAGKVWRAACKDAGVKNLSLHATRHTFMTQARRCHQRTDIIESLTHNAGGKMVDHYNHWEWDPQCEVMAALSFEDRSSRVIVASVNTTRNPAGFSAPPPGLEAGTQAENNAKQRASTKKSTRNSAAKTARGARGDADFVARQDLSWAELELLGGDELAALLGAA